MQSRNLFIALTVIMLVAVFINGAEALPAYIESSSFEKLSSLQKTPIGWFPTEIPKTKDYVEFIWDEEIAYKDKMSIYWYF